MRRVSFVLLALLFSFTAFTGLARAGESPDPKWYFGAGGGLGYISGPDWTVQDNYYNGLGYYATGGYGVRLGFGGSLYGGRRVQDYLDLEFGLTSIFSNHSTTYSNAAGSTIWSRRLVGFNAISASALLRPADDAAHFLYLKLGVHYSDYGTTITSINSSTPATSAIAAGDHIPSDAHYKGWGPLVGAGMDFGDRPGFIRLEYVTYLRIGGVSEHAGLLNVSYHHNF